jgi:predicted nucleic acid-binding protein
MGLSVISLAELYEGVHYSRNPRRSREVMLRFLDGVTMVPIDEEVCDLFGRERGKLRQQGRLIGDFDLLIAATCLRHDLTVCTNNRRHFEVVEGLRTSAFRKRAIASDERITAIGWRRGRHRFSIVLITAV